MQGRPSLDEGLRGSGQGLDQEGHIWAARRGVSSIAYLSRSPFRDCYSPLLGLHIAMVVCCLQIEDPLGYIRCLCMVKL